MEAKRTTLKLTGLALHQGYKKIRLPWNTYNLPEAKICHSHSEVLQEVAALYCMQPIHPTTKLTEGSFSQQLSPQLYWASFTQARNVSTA